DNLSVAIESTVTFQSAEMYNCRGQSYNWSVGTQGFGGGVCKLLNSGVVVADLRPTIDTSSTWWQGEFDYYPEYGGLIWFGGSNIYIGVRKTGPGSGITRNRIYRWPLEDAGGAIVGAAAI